WIAGLNGSLQENTYNESHAEVNYMAGAGVRYFFGPKLPLELRAEIEQYQIGSNFSSSKDSTLAIGAGLVYYLGNTSSNKKAVKPLPHALLSDASAAEGQALIFSLKLSEAVDTSIPFELTLDTDTQTPVTIASELSVDNGKNWTEISNSKFTLTQGQSAALIRITPPPGLLKKGQQQLKVQLSSSPDKINNPNLLASGTITSTDTTATTLVKAPTGVTPPLLSASMAAMETPPPLITPPLPVPKDPQVNAQQEISIVKLNAIKPDISPKKRVIPMLRPLDAVNSTAQELAISHFLWDELKAYNDFDSESPLLLPAIDQVNSVIQISATSDNKLDMYEAAEQVAGNAEAGVAVWGNVFQFKGHTYWEPHLSLVDKPLTFNVQFNTPDKDRIALSIPRTRFAFTLQEVTQQQIKQHNLMTIVETELYKKSSANSQVLSRFTAGSILKTSDNKNTWYKVQTDGSNSGWVKASSVAIVPEKVYLQASEIEVRDNYDSNSGNKIANPNKPLKVLASKRYNNATWLKLAFDDKAQWINAQFIKPKPVLAVTEFLVALQHFQRQDFNNAIQALKRFIQSADNQQENNVSLSTAYQMLALSYMQQGNWKNAVETINNALALTKYDPSIYNFRALAELGQQLNLQQNLQLAQVSKDLEYALYLEPEDTLSREIIKVLDKVLKLKKDNVVLFSVDPSDKHLLNQLFKHYQLAGLE
ncbi:MAG: GW dipeptide domain-containing protein, partial [Gammaproteobacteria bacterium]|nr:GW dipeptide domain-containing protein [Gammaproteobacteria bacterium]